MKRLLLIPVLVLAALARMPGAQGGFYHFEKDGLSFDYPVAWTLADNSNAQLQALMLSRRGSSAAITVYAQREPITTEAQLFDSYPAVTAPYVEKIAHSLGLKKPPGQDETQCTPAGGGFAVGYRMAGKLGGEPTTAEVYRVVFGQRLLHLVYVRNDKDEWEGAPAWKTLLDTLKVESAALSPEAAKLQDIVVGGIINKQAVKKPMPPYPAEAKFRRAKGTIYVRVVVDEEGNVIVAHAVNGHVSLREVSEEVARRAKFSPTLLCGKPVKVAGVITYNFVLK